MLESAKPTPIEIPRATGPRLFDPPDIAEVMIDPGTKPKTSAIAKAAKVIATRVNTKSPIGKTYRSTIIDCQKKIGSNLPLACFSHMKAGLNGSNRFN